jgi:hypothetical protein
MLQMRADEDGWPHDLGELRGALVQECEDYLHDVVNAALSGFSVRIGDLSTRRPTVYSVAFLQMYNQCANEPCRRTKQRLPASC